MVRTGEPSVAELMAQLAANAAKIAALKAEKEALSARVVKLEEELALARLHRFAPRSEKDVDRLFNEAEQIAGEDDGDSEDDDVIDLPDTGLPPAEKPEGKKRGRRPLPKNLPRERVEYDLLDDQKACPCCHHQMHRMGEAVTEHLHIEVKAKVLQNVRFKYACRNCDRNGINTPVIIAPMPAQPLPGRGQIHPQTFLGDYRGIVMSDGYSAWRTLEGATHIGCMAHSRRRFVDALKTRKKGGGPPEQALKFFEQLYRIERLAKDEKPNDGETEVDCIRRFRQQHSVPILNALKKWLDDLAPKGLAGQQARRCNLLYPEPMGLSDPLRARRQNADRQQHS
ncbi:IS66 family transposase [Agrobacterium tumefaciens]|uniref:IS66 family transposase n=1 Tax=Agrobacterium tumefaciens TaxID=358 RepID=UPI0022A92C0C